MTIRLNYKDITRGKTMFKRLAMMVALLIIPTLLLTGCFGGKTKGDQVLNLPESQEPPSLDPAKSTDATSAKILNNTTEGLYRTGENGELVLGMAAEKPKVSTDKKVYTFELRDAKWSDGKPVTAQDFVYGITRVLDPKTASEYANMNYHIKNGQAFNAGKAKADALGVKALDDKTLEITLENPVSYFEKLLTFTTYVPQREDIVAKYGDKFAQEADKNVYNGPFTLVKWEHGASLQLKPNENYWDRKVVKLKEVNILIAKDNGTINNLYKQGKLDWAPQDAAFATANQNNPDKITLQEARTTYVEYNSSLFKNAKVRKAISLAIDREDLAKNVLKDGSEAAGGLVPPSINAGDKKFRDQSVIKPQFNASEAKKLWEEGWKEVGKPAPASIELLGVDDSVVKKVMEYIQAQLKTNLGANIEIQPVPFKQRLDREKSGQFQLVLSGWQGDYNDPLTFMELFMTSNPFNYGHWSNATYDALISKAEKNIDVEGRAQDFVTAEKILFEETGVAPVCYKAKVGLLRPAVKGIVWHAVGPEYDLKWASIAG